MSTVYNAGPYATWTEVNFERPEFTVTVVYTTVQGIFIISPSTFISDPARLRGVFTGVDSGATLDTSLLPGVTSQSINGPVITACVVTFTNYYTLLGGPAPPAPAIGWSIFSDGISSYSVQGNSRTSYTYNSGTMTCDADFNAPTFPAFISGEKATLVMAE